EAEDGSWHTLLDGAGWADAERVGAKVSMVALRRDDITLPVFEGSPQPGTVLEIGVTVPAEEVEAIRARLPEGASLLSHEYDDLIFSDPFGYTWHIETAESGFLSNGEIAGHWLET
ncbi:MAG: hypothetical protein ACR2NL_05900, partial [Acidimicrobiia bacterium]